MSPSTSCTEQYLICALANERATFLVIAILIHHCQCPLNRRERASARFTGLAGIICSTVWLCEKMTNVNIQSEKKKEQTLNRPTQSEWSGAHKFSVPQCCSSFSVERVGSNGGNWATLTKVMQQSTHCDSLNVHERASFLSTEEGTRRLTRYLW